jgi:hypothetical protein
MHVVLLVVLVAAVLVACYYGYRWITNYIWRRCIRAAIGRGGNWATFQYSEPRKQGVQGGYYYPNRGIVQLSEKLETVKLLKENAHVVFHQLPADFAINAYRFSYIAPQEDRELATEEVVNVSKKC